MSKLTDLRHCTSFKLWVIIFTLFSYCAEGQDIHYSQFYNSPMNINPANTGVFNGDQRFIVSFRDQWRSVPVTWTTFSGNYDRKFYQKNKDNGFWSGGLLYNYDRQGDSKLNLNNINISASYTHLLNKQNVLTGGAMIGYSTRGFDQSSLRWDMQWTDGDYFSNLSSGENFDTERVSFLETALGVNYRWQKTSRTKVDVGVGLFHLVQPKPNFEDGDVQKLPMRLAINAIANFKVIDKLDIQLHALDQIQSGYGEIVFGGLAKIYVNENRGSQTRLDLGLGYRTSGSLFPTIAVSYNQFYLSGSYDIDLTEFGDIHGVRGGPEFHFTYIITSVKPLKFFKNCPIF